MTKIRVLVVAADANLRARLARMLLQAGYAVELAENPRHAREVAAKEMPALVVVAPQRMGPEAIEFAREIKERIDSLVLIGESGDELQAFQDLPIEPNSLVTMPFTEEDLLSRIKSELNSRTPTPRSTPVAATSQQQHEVQQVLTFEGFTLDPQGRTCLDAAGRELTLTRAEFSLLLAFVTKPGKVLSRDELTYVVAGRGAEPDDRSVDVLISRLRRKIERDAKTPRVIVTIPGEGYKFTARPQPVESAEHGITPSAPAQTDAKRATHPEHRNIANVRIWMIAAACLGFAAVGWTAWHFGASSQQTAATAPALSASEQARRAMVYKRMLTAMHDDRFNWRTVERLAIESGVDEAEAHGILAEHPDEIALGKSHDGKLIAKLVTGDMPEKTGK